MDRGFILIDPKHYVEWVRFVEPHLPEPLQQSPTHVAARTAPLTRDDLYPWLNSPKDSPMRRGYALRLIRNYPDQYAAFVAMLRVTNRL
jgi:hypothetical protein